MTSSATTGDGASEIFETYEREFQSLTADIEGRIADQVPNATGEAKKVLLNQTDRDIDEAEEIVGYLAAIAEYQDMSQTNLDSPTLGSSVDITNGDGTPLAPGRPTRQTPTTRQIIQSLIRQIEKGPQTIHFQRRTGSTSRWEKRRRH